MESSGRSVVDRGSAGTGVLVGVGSGVVVGDGSDVGVDDGAEVAVAIVVGDNVGSGEFVGAIVGTREAGAGTGVAIAGLQPASKSKTNMKNM